MAGDFRIESIEAPVGETLREEIYAFWRQQLGELDRDAAARRLSQVLALGRSGRNEVAATCSAVPARVAALGGQTLLVYRCLMSPAAASVERWSALLARASETLDRHRAEGRHADCIGLLVPVIEPAVVEARPEAIWADTGLIHAGYGQHGVPLRVRYFADARLSTGGRT